MSIKNFQTHDQETISYYDSEKGKEAVILIHGFPFSHEMWQPQIEVLKKNFRVIAPDLRGMGGSSQDYQYTMEMLADDLIALILHLNLKQAHAVGFSMGGYVLLRAVEKRPELFSSLVLADTQTAADTNEGKKKRTEALLAIKTRGLEAYGETFLTKAVYEENRKDRPILMEELNRLIARNSSRGAMGQILAMLSRTDTTSVLEKIHVPVLILVGQEDQITPITVAHDMGASIKGAIMRVIPRAGHISNQENEEYFNLEVLSFFKMQTFVDHEQNRGVLL